MFTSLNLFRLVLGHKIKIKVELKKPIKSLYVFLSSLLYDLEIHVQRAELLEVIKKV